MGGPIKHREKYRQTDIESKGFMGGPIKHKEKYRQTDIESKGYSPQTHCRVISMVLEKTDRCKKYLLFLIFTKSLILQMIPDDCGCSEASLLSVMTHPVFYHLYSHTAHCSMFVSLSVPRTMTGA